MIGWLQSLDKAVFIFINQTCANPFFDRIMPLLSDLGRGDTLFLIALIILIVAPREMKRMAILVIAGLTITYYFSDFLKSWIARPRPFMAIAGTHLLMKATGYSMPSGHATQTFMAMTIFAGFFRRYTALFLALGIAVAFSRIYVGNHYMLDVLAGALCGTFVGWALLKLSGEPKRV